MKRTYIPKLDRNDGMSVMWTAGSRVALLLTAVVIFCMPLTEYLWDFDRFLCGGQDFEFGLLSIAMILCLVMVLLQHAKHAVKLLLAMRKWLSFVFRHSGQVAPGSFTGLMTSLYPGSIASPSLSRYNLPLQV